MKAVRDKTLTAVLITLVVGLLVLVPTRVALAVPPPITPGTTYYELFSSDPNFALVVSAASGEQPTDEVSQADLDAITFLDGSDAGISDITGISYLQNLQRLNLSDNPNLVVLPTEIGELIVLNRIEVSGCALEVLPEEIGGLTNVEYINFNDNLITHVPSSIGNLSALTTLLLGDNELQDVPNEITSLTNLETLNLGSNLLDHVPVPMLHLQNLKALYLDHNNLSGAIPSEISQLTQLRLLYIHNNHITALPDTLKDMAALENFAANNNDIAVIPPGLETLPLLKLLHINNNNVVSALPDLSPSVDYNNSTMTALLAPKTILTGSPLSYTDLVPDAMVWAYTKNGNTFAGLGSWSLTRPDGSSLVIAAGDGSEINESLFHDVGSYSLVFTFGQTTRTLLQGSVYTMSVLVETAPPPVPLAATGDGSLTCVLLLIFGSTLLFLAAKAFRQRRLHR